MNMWNVKSYKLISKLVASDSPYYTWCPDGERILTATCAPRLRVHLGTRAGVILALSCTSMVFHHMWNYGQFLGMHFLKEYFQQKQ